MSRATYSCPVCGSKKTLQYKLSNYLICGICKSIFQKRFPKAEYKEEYYQGKSGIFQSLFAPVANILYLLRNRYVGRKVNTWVDIGAGEGSYLNSVNAQKKIGIEISSFGRKRMKKLGIKTLDDTQFLKRRKLNADVVSFWHVLEHIKEPRKYLLAASNNLKSDGKLVIGVPNGQSLDFRLFGKFWFHLAPEFHYIFYSPKALKLILEKTGFYIEKIDYWSLEHHLPGVLQSFINLTSGSDNALHKLVKRGTGQVRFSIKDLFASIFWTTLGLPFVLIFWVYSSMSCQSGTIVVVASRKDRW